MSYIWDNLHFILIHVPIAMLLFSFVFDGAGLLLKRRDWHTAGLLCLVIGTLGAIGAVLTGPEEMRNTLLPRHELFGKLTMFFFIVLTLVRVILLWRKKRELGRNVVYLAAALIGVLLVSYTGHLGGQMVHPDRSQFPQMGPGGPGGTDQGFRPGGPGGGQGQGGQGQGGQGMRPGNGQSGPQGQQGQGGTGGSQPGQQGQGGAPQGQPGQGSGNSSGGATPKPSSSPSA